MGRLLRLAAGSTTIALAAGTLTAAPAEATIVAGYVDSDVKLYALNLRGYTGCTLTTPVPSHRSPDLTDDGAWVSDSLSASSTVTKNGATVATESAGGSLRARMTSYGGPARFDLGGSATATVSAPAYNGECQGQAASHQRAGVSIDVTRPMWVTLGATATGGDGALTLRVVYFPSSNGVEVASVTATGKASSTSTLLLRQRGEYSLDGDVAAATGVSGGTITESISGSVWATLTPAGYAASRQSGRARRLVRFAGSLDCAHGALTARISKKARKRAKKVVIRVNGVRKAVVKGKRLRRKHVVTLRGIPATSRARVVATVTPEKGRAVRTSRSYLPCG